MANSFFRPLLRRLIRGGIGLGFGWMISSVVCLIWCGIGSARYGDLEVALEKFKSEPFSIIIFGGIFAGMFGSFVGAGIAPAVLGPCSYRYPVPAASLLGGTVAAIFSTAFGLFLAEMIERELPKSHWVILGPSILSVAVGIASGWWVANQLTDSKAHRSRKDSN